MKLVTFVLHSETPVIPRIGVLIDKDSNIADLQAGHQILTNNSCPYFQDMLAFLDGGEAALNLAEKVKYFITTQRPPTTIHTLSNNSHNISLLSPVPRPRSLRDCMVFEKHLIQATRTVVSWKLPLVAQLDALVEKMQGKPLLKVPEIWYKSRNVESCNKTLHLEL
jgi:hypothetical protein